MYKKIILSMVLIFCLAGCAITPKSDNAHDNAAQNNLQAKFLPEKHKNK